MNRQLKHREISRQLRGEITAGRFAPAGRLPPEKRLVERFRVSRPTVARALRDLQDEGLVERRAGSGTWLRNPAARSTGTRQLGLLMPNLGTTDVFEVIAGELAVLARTHDYSLPGGTESSAAPAGCELSPDQALKLCGQFIGLRVAGVFFAPFAELSHRDEINQRIAERLVKAGITVVLLDRDLLPFPRRSNFDLVGVDNLAGGCLLGEHLVKLGCRRMAFAAFPHLSPSIQARIAGAREALAAHRFEVPPDWVHRGNPDDLKFARALSGGRRWDAVICANDLMAAGLQRQFEKDGLRVPHDLPVVGFDDAKYSQQPGVSLTTMRQPCRDIAVTAFHAMIERIANPTLPARCLLLTPQLVVRESCGVYLSREAAHARRRR